MAVLIYFIFFFILFVRNYKNKGMNGGTFLILVYLVASVMSLLLIFYYETYEIELISYKAVIFHISCLFFFIYPLVYFLNKDISSYKVPSIKNLNIFSLLIISFCLLSIANSIPKLGVAFSFEDLSEARKLHNHRELFEEESSSNILMYFGSFGHHFSFFAVFLFFYYSCFYTSSKKIIVLLFISSMAVVLANLSIMGRDGIARWILFFAFSFCLFRNYLPTRLAKRILKYSIISAIPIISIFILISISRFSDDTGLLYSIVDYFGQPMVLFSYNFDRFYDSTFGGSLTFPIFFDSAQRTSMNNLNDSVYSEFNLNTFPTFVGSFYIDMGFLGTLLLSLGFFFVSMGSLVFSKSISFSKLIALLIITQIVLLGVFYFMFYGVTVVKSLLLVLCFSIFIQYRSRLKFGS